MSICASSSSASCVEMGEIAMTSDASMRNRNKPDVMSIREQCDRLIEVGPSAVTAQLDEAMRRCVMLGPPLMSASAEVSPPASSSQMYIRDDPTLSATDSSLVDSDAVAHTLIVAVLICALAEVQKILSWPFTVPQADVMLGAVRWSTSPIVEALAADVRIPVNRGYVLREAVKLKRPDVISILLRCPRVDPNRGVPLFYAATAGDLETVQQLLSHTRIRVNRCTLGYGSTALCQAIACEQEDVVRLLLNTHGVNINKGYLLSPLQLAVHVGNTRIIDMLLACPDISPEKSYGDSQPPLHMVMQRGDARLFRSLLRSEKLQLEEDDYDNMEERGLLDLQQTVVELQRPLFLGRVWKRRVALMTLGILSLLLHVVAEMSLLYFYAAVALQPVFAALTAIIPFMWAPAMQYAHTWMTRRTLYGHLPPRLHFLAHLPSVPVLEMIVYYCTVSRLFDEQDVYTRESSFEGFQYAAVLQACHHAAPQLVLQIIIALLRIGHPGGGEITTPSIDEGVPYEAETVPYNYILAVVTSSLSVVYGIYAFRDERRRRRHRDRLHKD
eukprot:PhM_4_TR7157/c0_g1_i1/m.78596